MKKRILSLIMTLVMVTSLFYGCKDTAEIVTNKQEEKVSLPPMTKEEITLSYYLWQDIEIAEKLAEEFEKKYPNITVEVEQLEISSSSSYIWDYAAIGKNHDCFWVVGSPDTLIENGFIYDMTEFWENDPDSKNVIKGINEFKLGYLGTDKKWITPAKFFPTAAFVNMDVFIRNGVDMPNKDWTWDEFEQTVEKMTMTDKAKGVHIFGQTTGCTVITWYPLASDKSCIGEFGWNGTEFDMKNWAYGMSLEAKWINNENKPLELDRGGGEQLAQLYGEGVLYPQDFGYSAIHCDNWWTWEDYWITDQWIVDNKVVFVPYIMPHTKEAQGGNYIATMDMGAISAATEHPREAYELLKFMTWGTEGWEYKLKHYPNLLEESTGCDRAVSKNNCPITLDKEIWEGFEKWHPNTETGDEYMVELYGEEYDRSEYFTHFFEKVRNGKWTCYAGQQILGFDTWLQNVYYGNDGQHYYGYPDGLGIEKACIYGGVEPLDYYETIEKEGNEINKKKLDELKKAK